MRRLAHAAGVLAVGAIVFVCPAHAAGVLAVGAIVFVCPARAAATEPPSDAIAEEPGSDANEPIVLGSTEEARSEESRLSLGGLPLIKTSRDIGFGYGAQGAVFSRDERWRPYRWTLRAQVFLTTGGLQDHFLSFDAPFLFGPDWRPQVRIGYLRDPIRPWYGPGNESEVLSERDPLWVDDYHRYALTSLFGELWLERRLGKGFEAAAGYSIRSGEVEAAEGTLVEVSAPVGSEGGRVGQLSLELAWDVRDNEASTTEGAYLSLAARAAHPALGSTEAFAGVTALLRGWYAPLGLGPRFVVAARLAVDGLFGDVPMWQLPAFGARGVLEGLGGAGSLRGLDRHRHVGGWKLLGNLELRSRVLRLTPGGRPLDLWAVLFTDTGRVWAASAPDGGGLHLTTGGGLRVGWDEDFVMRFDAGTDGDRFLFYLDFGQLF